MAEKRTKSCDVCEKNSFQKHKLVWCRDCEFYICETCSKVHNETMVFRSHRVATDSELDRLGVFSSIMICKRHNKKLTFICDSHGDMICSKCILLKHSQCKLKDLNEYSDETKESNIEVTENIVEKAVKQIEDDIRFLVETIKSTNENEEMIRGKISAMRKTLNEHLDKLEDKVLKEFLAKHDEQRRQAMELKVELDKNEKVLKQCEADVVVIKKLATNAELYVNLQQVQKTVNEIQDHLDNLKSERPLAFTEVEFDMRRDPQFERLESEVQEFTSIVDSSDEEGSDNDSVEVAEESTNSLEITEDEDDLQPEFNSVKMKRIGEINLKKGQLVMNITGCAILQNNKVIFADNANKRLILHKTDGTFLRTMKLMESPFDLAVFDNNSVVLSYNTRRKYLLDIVSIDPFERQTIFSEISFNNCWGVSCSEGYIFVVFYPEGIKQLNRKGDIIKTILVSVHHVYHIHAFEDRIYYTVRDNNSVCCCDMTGCLLWQLKDDKLAASSKCPAGLSVDNEGNVFVVGSNENILLILRNDGEEYKVLLDKSDKLNAPRTVHYDRKSKCMLVCNKENGYAALYDTN